MKTKIEADYLREVFDRGIINVGNPARIRKVMKRADSGEAIKVGFIGGSITAGAAASDPENCYAYRVYLWWKAKFPNSSVEFINAGVGATTSEFGVSRVEQDLLELKPDMVFAEFSVNDDDDDQFMETYEGLIRKILLYPTEPALFLLNNAFYDDGRNAQRVHNTIGTYYDLPIVSIRESIFFEVAKGTLKNTDVSADNLHPNDFGHTLVAGVVNHLLEKIYDKAFQSGMAAGDYTVPSEPFTANRYYTSMRWNNTNSNPVLIGFQKDETKKQGVWDNFRYGWYSKNAGSRIRFETEASIISIQYRKYAIHPAPAARLIIDGDDKNSVILDANFDETWGDKLYLQNVFFDVRRRRHTVEIIITDEAAGKDFYLASLITA